MEREWNQQNEWMDGPHELGRREDVLEGVVNRGVHRCHMGPDPKVTSAFALRQRQLLASLVTSPLQAPLPGMLRSEDQGSGQTCYLPGRPQLALPGPL